MNGYSRSYSSRIVMKVIIYIDYLQASISVTLGYLFDLLGLPIYLSGNPCTAMTIAHSDGSRLASEFDATA